MPSRLLPALILAAVVLGGGCERASEQLALDDLSAAERRYVTRYILLERARAVALADPVAGIALLDSLALAWEDTAAAQARADLPTEPGRAAALHDLVRRLLEAEADSLVYAPRADRLDEPLPEPPAE